jgi:acyl transferase domain-containing protein
MACRVAGANSPSKLWENIMNKIDLQKPIPKDRLNIDGFYHPNGQNKGTVS